jgi:hypothetical protein
VTTETEVEGTIETRTTEPAPEHGHDAGAGTQTAAPPEESGGRTEP